MSAIETAVPRPVAQPKAGLRLTALIVWGIVVVVVLVRAALASRHHTVFNTYFGAGRNWLAGKDLYEGSAGFVYSPLVAAFFAPFTFLKGVVSQPLWLAISIAGFLGALVWSLRERLIRLSGEQQAFVFLLLLPLSVGNFNNGQVNPLVIGLLLAGVVAIQRRWMWVSAFCIALAVYFKIYPIALGLVLMVAYPKEFAWRFLFALVLLGALSFVLQRPPYVLSQYQLWFATRTADQRHEAGIVRDGFMILKALNVNLSERAHQACQALTGGAIALLALLGRFRFRWREDRLLIAIFFLVDAWMLLCGPATESATYVMLAPAVACALVVSFGKGLPGGIKGLAIASYSFLLLGTAINSFLRLPKTPVVMSVQPLGAVFFACFAFAWVWNDRFWAEEDGLAEGGEPGN